MGQELRSAPERRYRPGGGERDRARRARRAAVKRRRVLKGQQGEHKRGDRDRRHDPEQGPPGVRARLQPAGEWPERNGTEDTHAHDHRRLAQALEPEAERQRRHGRDEQKARAQPLENVAGNEHGRVTRRGLEHRTNDEHPDIEDHHPPLVQKLGELHRQHRADRVGGVAHPRGQAHLLKAHVQAVSDDRRDRSDRGRQSEIRDQRRHHHRRRGRIAASQGAAQPQVALVRSRGGGRRSRHRSPTDIAAAPPPPRRPGAPV